MTLLPSIETPVTVTGYNGVPGLFTVKALGKAVVDERASLSVIVIMVPEVSVVAELQVGAFWSTVEEFGERLRVNVAASFPVRS
jgi:hypothetical protein